MSRDDGARTAEIAAGRSAYARIRLEAPAVLTRGDRFILRSYSPSITIGGGVVLDPQPPRAGIRSPAALGRFRRLDHAGAPQAALDQALTAFIDERAGAGLPRAALIRRGGLSEAAADSATRRLTAEGNAALVGDLLVAPDVIRDLSDSLLAALKSHHAAQPLSEGLPREEARERLFGRAAPSVFEHVLSELARDQKIIVRDRLALAGHQVSLSPEEAHAHAAIERVFREAGLTPPDMASLPAAASVAAAVAD